MKYAVSIAILSLALTGTAMAAPMTYHGNNPDISPSAYPSNSAAITEQANQTRPHNPATSSFQQQTQEQLVQSSVASTLSQQLTSFNNSSLSGTIHFADGSFATYSTGPDPISGVRTRFIDFHNLDGTTTEISFPI